MQLLNAAQIIPNGSKEIPPLEFMEPLAHPYHGYSKIHTHTRDLENLNMHVESPGISASISL